MPTYGYQCIDCKHEFSVFQAMKDDPIAICPVCTGPVKRLLYPVGIVFKGSGWYINDSRKPDTSESADTSDKSNSKGSEKTKESEKSSGKDSSGDSSKTESSTSSGDKSSETAKPAAAVPAATSTSGQK